MPPKSGFDSSAARRSPLRPGGLAGWILARLHNAYMKQSFTQKEMSVVETLALGGRRQLMLIECGGDRFLVGCGVDSIETIVPIPAAPDVSGRINSLEDQQ